MTATDVRGTKGQAIGSRPQSWRVHQSERVNLSPETLRQLGHPSDKPPPFFKGAKGQAPFSREAAVGEVLATDPRFRASPHGPGENSAGWKGSIFSLVPNRQPS